MPKFIGPFVITKVDRLMSNYQLELLTEMKLSRTQVTIQDITQICNEIRNIKNGPPKHNKLKIANTINILASNTPAPSPDIHGRGGHDGAENKDNKLHLNLPTNSQDNRTHCVPSPLPTQTSYNKKPPAPLSSCTPPAAVARTSSLASSNAAVDPEASPSDERMASGSPDSPDEIKASSRR